MGIYSKLFSGGPAGAVLAPDELTADTLVRILSARGWDASKDSDGDVVANSGAPRFGCILFRLEGRVRVLAPFRPEPRASQRDLHRLAGRINQEYVMIRCAHDARQNAFIVDYDIHVGDGLPSETIGACVEKFREVTLQALNEYAQKLLK